MNTKTTFPRLFSFCALAAILGSAQAFGQSTMIATGTPTGGSFSGLGNATQNFTFTNFNSAYGTLTEVQIELNGVALSGKLYGANETGAVPDPGNIYNPENISLDLQGTITVTSSAGGSVGLSANTAMTAMQDANGTTGYVIEPSKAGGTASDGGIGDFTQQITVGSTAPVGPNNNTTTITGSGVSGYVGTGSASVSISVVGSNFGNNGNASLDTAATGYVAGPNNNTGVGLFGSAVASGAVEIIYTYTPVPEPAQTAAWMMGFAGLILVVRNYFRRQASPASIPV